MLQTLPFHGVGKYEAIEGQEAVPAVATVAWDTTVYNTSEAWCFAELRRQPEPQFTGLFLVSCLRHGRRQLRAAAR